MGGSFDNDEEQALIRAAQVDLHHFTAVYRRYFPRVYNYIAGRVGDRASAEDTTSTVFLKALEALPDYQPRGSFVAWLFTIARHEVVSHYRRQRKELSFDEQMDSISRAEPEAEAQVAHKEALRWLGELVQELDEEKQELLHLRFGAGLTHAEIGEVLGKSEAATKMALHRLLRRLRIQWKEQNEGTKPK